MAFAYPASSPLVPEHEGEETMWAWLYLVAMALAFAAYLAGLFLVRRVRRRRPRAGRSVALACAVQLLPLAGPVLLSTDVYTYWDYARISTEHGGNPYVDVPSDYPDDPAFPLMGSYWHDTTSVYGPGFTLASEGACGRGRELAGRRRLALPRRSPPRRWSRSSCLPRGSRPQPAFAAAFVGWNPLLAVHFAGGGHNDAWMMAFVLGGARARGLREARARRRRLGGGDRDQVGAAPLPAAPAARGAQHRPPGRPPGLRRCAAIVIVALATWRYGLSWIGAAGPLATNLAEDRAWYAIPVRIASLGAARGRGRARCSPPASCVAYAWLLREAWRGRARLALTAGLLLVCTSWLVPWYAVWAVPLAAVEEDRTARMLALALSAYLLRDAVPI